MFSLETGWLFTEYSLSKTHDVRSSTRCLLPSDTRAKLGIANFSQPPQFLHQRPQFLHQRPRTMSHIYSVVKGRDYISWSIGV